jgi:hypothetical protein
MSNYRADCGSCCGLCCVAPDQLKSQGFPLDKPADTPCVHLDALHRCAIHATRRNHGYLVCKFFDCFGAGQWVTQRLFGGASWTDSPETARDMFTAYRYRFSRFEAAALIEAALPYVREDARCSLTARMTELTSGETIDRFGPSDAGQLRRETLAVIRSALRIDDGSL